MINRAAPAGSMRYFALLYTPPELRDAVMALYVIDAEIRESAQSANHDVAHTRLQWWRQEIDRLVNNNAQHPAARILQSIDGVDCKRYAKLHELIAAADMDLARMTYLNAQELRAYASRSGGMVQELIAQLLTPGTLADSVRLAANRIGTGIRQAEMLRDLRQDAQDGRLYLPLDELEQASLAIEHLRAREISPALQTVLSRFRTATSADLEWRKAELAPASRAYLRPLFVLAALHRRLLDRIARSGYAVATQRIELGPIEKPWVAWRAARKAG
ncbi:MAG TPA: squalene/phytoene synthase family protein [Povalibacter sp.]